MAGLQALLRTSNGEEGRARMPTPAHHDYAFETSAEGAVEGFSHGTHLHSVAESHHSGMELP